MNGSRQVRVFHENAAMLESPRWHNGRLYFSDFFDRKVLVKEPGGTAETLAIVPQQPSGIGWLPDGRMLVVSMLDRRLLRLESDGSLSEHADLSQFTDVELNDMVVDDQGRAWVTSFGFDLHGGAPIAEVPFFRVDPDGTSAVVGEPMRFPNGPMIGMDGRTLIYGESLGARMSIADITAGGALVNVRPWAVFGEMPTTLDLEQAMREAPAAPDGACLDAEGCAWVADAVNPRAIRVKQDVGIIDEVPVDPELSVFAATLGGDDGRTLFLCASPVLDEPSCLAQRAAKVLAVEVDVPSAAHARRAGG